MPDTNQSTLSRIVIVVVLVLVPRHANFQVRRRKRVAQGLTFPFMLHGARGSLGAYKTFMKMA